SYLTPIFDHLVVAARTLEEGGAWVEAKLGVAPVAGGKHPTMGTHNRLLRIGPREFLEVIAIDPEAPAPSRPRWFDLDSPQMLARLEEGPALIHWVERTPDLDAALRDYSEPVEALSLSRGPYRWRIGVPRDGRRPGGGSLPTLIQWEGAMHPADALPESGCRLEGFALKNGHITADFATASGMRRI
ncbi:MAG TPA: VOC family protein, partial [Usitatibacter sp.]